MFKLLGKIFMFAPLLLSGAQAADYPATPVAVVEAYIKADSAGAAMNAATWSSVQQYTQWPAKHSWDGCLVVKKHQIAPGKEADGKATVVVNYDVLGEFDGVRVAMSPRQDQLTLELAKQGNQWKIMGAPAKPRLTTMATLPLLQEQLEQAKGLGDPSVVQQIEESIRALK
ncbi:hypothetical protein HNQ59_001469 [Chitinivorax tropicus]|uniref:Uncharacterized protein n=1 Tax=Chitinivorax tropicus TaxID=714531 RepID=A0A840MG11_9PROT|nr:hypothetical protein [Chitinivorax tropicus]MBB5018184.1 hypothetical protein [Chitinivorax tropicus]